MGNTTHLPLQLGHTGSHAVMSLRRSEAEPQTALCSGGPPTNYPFNVTACWQVEGNACATLKVLPRYRREARGWGQLSRSAPISNLRTIMWCTAADRRALQTSITSDQKTTACSPQSNNSTTRDPFHTCETDCNKCNYHCDTVKYNILMCNIMFLCAITSLLLPFIEPYFYLLLFFLLFYSFAILRFRYFILWSKHQQSSAPKLRRVRRYITTIRAFRLLNWNQTHNLELGSWSVHQLYFLCFYWHWENYLWGWFWGGLLPRCTFIPASFDVAAAFTAAPLSGASLIRTSWMCFWRERHCPSSSPVAFSSPAPRRIKHRWRSREMLDEGSLYLWWFSVRATKRELFLFL